MSRGNGSGGNDVTVAVVGDGFGSLLVYVTALYLGFDPERIGIFGKGSNPVGTYQQFAWNLGQTILRSESESHFLPADWPTFAQLDAWSRKDPSPLFRSAFRKFNPGVPDIMAEAQLVSKALGWESRIIGGTHVGWVVREPGPPAHFSLYDEDAHLPPPPPPPGAARPPPAGRGWRGGRPPARRPSASGGAGGRRRPPPGRSS